MTPMETIVLTAIFSYGGWFVALVSGHDFRPALYRSIRERAEDNYTCALLRVQRRATRKEVAQ